MKDEVEPPPVEPPHDVSQTLHYQPVLDPESEFSWHRPDDRIVEEQPEKNKDMTDVHDPWEIYRGNIPPISEEQSVQHSHVSVDNLEEIRQYAWDYQHEQHAPPQNVHEQYQHQEQNWPPQNTHHHEHYSHHDSYQHHNEPPQQDYSQTYQNSEQHWSNAPQHDYSPSQETSHSYHDQSNNYQEHWHDQFHDNSQQNQEHQEDHHHQPHYHQQSSHSYDDHHAKEHHSHDSNHNHHEPQFHRDDESNKHHDHHDHTHQVQQQHVYYKHSDTHTHAHEVEVRHVLAPEKKRNRRPRRLRIDIVTNETNGLMNGDISETESDNEEIVPRHPYDGFYLRHRPTIDARGRKICSHEIPPTPSPTLSPPDSPTPEDYQTAEETEPSDDENQVSLRFELPKQFSKVNFDFIRSNA